MAFSLHPAAATAPPLWSAPARRTLAALLVALLLIAPLSAARDPAGSPELVSPPDGLSHLRPAVAASPAGVVVVWQGQAGSPPSYEILARRYDAAGNALGPAFRVNAHIAGDQRRPAAAMLADGGFVVAWDSFGPSPAPGEGRNVYLRRFDAGGAPLGGDLLANTRRDGSRFAPALAASPAGGFALAWHGAVPGDNNGVAFRRYAGSGSPLDAEERLPYDAALADTEQSDGSLAFDDAGKLAIIWETYRYDEVDDRDIYTVAARRYDNAGAPVGAEQTLASGDADDFPCDPDVAAGTGGRVVAVWARGESAVELARLDQPGAAPLVVSRPQPAARAAPAVALDADGSALVVWADATTRSGSRFVGLAARSIGPDGALAGDEFYPGLPPLYLSTDVEAVAVAAAPGAGRVVAWQNEEAGATGPAGSIYLRRYPGAAPTPSPTVASQTPAPTSETPAPTSETPAPTSETPAPTSETTTPASETTTPASETTTPTPAGLDQHVFLPTLGK